ncbi:MAG: NAD-dependent epimerase/dehydratase family protein [Candidatus Kerfeldbacteria bacterium]|nr:NAD-dependent epimerase/dehydratase family protein [Candidatus Kerfeldbacteria bacterium]
MTPTSSSERKNILVIGGAGFIGSHLCEELVKVHNVICLDDFSTGRVENINHLLQNSHFEFLKHDISQPINLVEAHELDKFKVRFLGVQEIYYLATPTSPKKFNEYRIQTLRANSQGVINALELARNYKAKFLFASSAVMYGPRFANAPLFSEEYFGYVDPISPRANYDEGKRFGETAVNTYHDVYNLDTRIARIFRTYGPRLSLFDGHMIPDFVLQALNNKPLVIYGDESFTTSLCFVSDIVEALLKLMQSHETEPVNFGHYEECKMTDIAQLIKQMTNSQSVITHKPSLLFMSPLGLPDITRAKEKLGWYPLITLTDGLHQTIEYVKANQNVLQPMLNRYDEE